jgi:hypothetical protein
VASNGFEKPVAADADRLDQGGDVAVAKRVLIVPHDSLSSPIDADPIELYSIVQSDLGFLVGDWKRLQNLDSQDIFCLAWADQMNRSGNIPLRVAEPRLGGGNGLYKIRDPKKACNFVTLVVFIPNENVSRKLLLRSVQAPPGPSRKTPRGQVREQTGNIEAHFACAGLWRLNFEWEANAVLYQRTVSFLVHAPPREEKEKGKSGNRRGKSKKRARATDSVDKRRSTKSQKIEVDDVPQAVALDDDDSAPETVAVAAPDKDNDDENDDDDDDEDGDDDGDDDGIGDGDHGHDNSNEAIAPPYDNNIPGAIGSIDPGTYDIVVPATNHPCCQSLMIQLQHTLQAFTMGKPTVRGSSDPDPMLLQFRFPAETRATAESFFSSPIRHRSGHIKIRARPVFTVPGSRLDPVETCWNHQPEDYAPHEAPFIVGPSGLFASMPSPNEMSDRIAALCSAAVRRQYRKQHCSFDCDVSVSVWMRHRATGTLVQVVGIFTLWLSASGWKELKYLHKSKAQSTTFARLMNFTDAALASKHPLMPFASTDCPSIVRALVQSGRYDLLPLHLGTTPLHIAAAFGSNEVIKELLLHPSAAATLLTSDTMGFTPKQIAIISLRFDVVAMLDDVTAPNSDASKESPHHPPQQSVVENAFNHEPDSYSVDVWDDLDDASMLFARSLRNYAVRFDDPRPIAAKQRPRILVPAETPPMGIVEVISILSSDLDILGPSWKRLENRAGSNIFCFALADRANRQGKIHPKIAESIDGNGLYKRHCSLTRPANFTKLCVLLPNVKERQELVLKSVAAPAYDRPRRKDSQSAQAMIRVGARKGEIEAIFSIEGLWKLSFASTSDPNITFDVVFQVHPPLLKNGSVKQTETKKAQHPVSSSLVMNNGQSGLETQKSKKRGRQLGFDSLENQDSPKSTKLHEDDVKQKATLKLEILDTMIPVVI